jgi:hypothetical protein
MPQIKQITFGKICCISDFGLHWWLTFDVNFAPGYLHHVDVGSVADVSKVHATSIFMVEEYRVGEFLCMYRFIFLKIMDGKSGGRGTFKDLGVHKKTIGSQCSERSPTQVLNKYNVA